jgi:hypothetical protein
MSNDLHLIQTARKKLLLVALTYFKCLHMNSSLIMLIVDTTFIYVQSLAECTEE